MIVEESHLFHWFSQPSATRSHATCAHVSTLRTTTPRLCSPPLHRPMPVCRAGCLRAFGPPRNSRSGRRGRRECERSVCCLLGMPGGAAVCPSASLSPAPRPRIQGASSLAAAPRTQPHVHHHQPTTRTLVCCRVTLAQQEHHPHSTASAAAAAGNGHAAAAAPQQQQPSAGPGDSEDEAISDLED